MIRIILSDEQVQVADTTEETVQLCDRSGRIVGYLSRPADKNEIAEARRRLNSGGPWFTTVQVLSHLQSLEQG